MRRKTDLTDDIAREILTELLSVNHGWWCDNIVEYTDKRGRLRQTLANRPYFSPAFLRMYDYSTEEMNPWALFRDKETTDAVLLEIAEAIRPGSKPRSGRLVAYTRTNEKKLVEAYIRRIDRADGTAILASLHSDLTISSEVQWIERNVLDKLQAFVFVKRWDPITKRFMFTHMNGKLINVLKPDLEKLAAGSLSDDDFFNDWAQKRAFREDDETIRTADDPDLVIMREETFTPHTAVQPVPERLLTFKTPLSIPSRGGREHGWEILGIAIDVTSVTDVLRFIADRSHNGLYIKTENMRYHYVNSELLTLLNVPTERLILDRTLAESLNELRGVGAGPDTDDIYRHVDAFANEDKRVLDGETIVAVRELSLGAANDWLTTKQPINSRNGKITHLMGETSPLFPGRLGDILDKLPQCISVKKYYPDEVGRPGEFKLVWANRSFLEIHKKTDRSDVIGRTDADLWPGDPEQVEQFRRRDQLAVEKYMTVRGRDNWAALSPESRWAEIVKELSDPDHDRRCWEFRETTRSKSQTRVLQTTKWVEEYCDALFVVVVYSDVTKGDTEQRRYHELTTHNLRGATSPDSTARIQLRRILEGAGNVTERIQAAIRCLDDTSHAVELFLKHHLKLLKMDVECRETNLASLVSILKCEGEKLTRNWDMTVNIADTSLEATVLCDLTLLRFALNELLLNAVKAAHCRREELAESEAEPYTPIVTVGFDRLGSDLRCTVENNGAACIDQEAREKLEKSFTAARINPFDPHSHSHGLSFCVVAVRAQGGRIELVPPTPNWTKFEIFLPLIHHGSSA